MVVFVLMSAPRRRLPSAVKAQWAMLGFALIYGSFFGILKLALDELGIVPSAMLRLMGSAVLMIIIETVWLNSKVRDWPSWRVLIFSGFCVVFWVQTAASVAVSLTTSFHATLIMSTIPLQSALYAKLLGRETLSAHKLLGITLGGVGVLWLITSQLGQAALPSTYWVGDCLVAVNSALFSFYLILSKPLVERHGPLSVLAYTTTMGGVLAVLAVTLASLWPQAGLLTLLPTWAMLGATLAKLSLVGWGVLLYLIVFAGVVGYWLSNYALSKLPASSAASYILLQPVWAALLGYFWLNEHFSWPMLWAGLLTMLGVKLATLGRAPWPWQPNLAPWWPRLLIRKDKR
jgi:drug/metabolite transporter (DMT)-like permease